MTWLHAPKIDLDTDGEPIRLEQIGELGSKKASFSWWWSSEWETESGVGRMVDGLAHRLDRLRAIGNGQVPAVASKSWGLLSIDGYSADTEKA